MWLCCLPVVVKQDYFVVHTRNKLTSMSDVLLSSVLSAYLHEDDSGFLKQWDVSQYIIIIFFFLVKELHIFFYSNAVNLYFYKLKNFKR